jgi:hypothetical protein
MRRFSIKQTVVMVGAVAALALGSGVVPGATNSTPTAQAAELAQPRGRADFQGHRFFAREGFSHRYWGWGYHRFYPQYYVSYAYEPVSVCSTYYFDDGVWYCFTGY